MWQDATWNNVPPCDFFLALFFWGSGITVSCNGINESVFQKYTPLCTKKCEHNLKPASEYYSSD